MAMSPPSGSASISNSPSLGGVPPLGSPPLPFQPGFASPASPSLGGAGLPPPPPRPDFTNRIKLINDYRALRSRLALVKSAERDLKNELDLKKAKEQRLQDEVNLLLDQIALYRERFLRPQATVTDLPHLYDQPAS